MIAEIKDEILRLRELHQAILAYHPNTSDYDVLDEYEDIYAELDEVSSEILDSLGDLKERIDDLVPDDED